MKLVLLLPIVALMLAGAADAPKRYLAAGSVDLTRILPPAPIKGDIRYETDRAVFKAMKRQVGTPRWRAAIADIRADIPSVMRAFDCAAGVTLDPQTLPATTRLLTMAATDTGVTNNIAKDSWRRERPFHIDKGETCEPPEELGKSFDYPSGHSTRGWTLGLILADLFPAQANAILARARAYGESRIVCRVHNMSAIDAGRLGATATMEQVRMTPAYQRDFAAAQAEVVAMRASGVVPDAGRCTAEKALLEPSVLAALKR